MQNNTCNSKLRVCNCDIVCMHAGLQIRPVKFQGQDTVSHFTYQWSRTTDTPQRMDWLLLTEQEDYPDQHIRLHKLEKDSDLQVLMAMLDASPAAALLLINKKNSYDIDRSYFPPGEQVCAVEQAAMNCCSPTNIPLYIVCCTKANFSYVIRAFIYSYWYRNKQATMLLG